jgi:hypothetical protein
MAAATDFLPSLNPDRECPAYRAGYRQGFNGRRFFNPCAGNPLATDSHYFGFIKGQADATGELKAVS